VPIALDLHTGLRMGELLGLRWRDCDLDNGRLSIQQTAYQVRGGGTAFGPTKTHRSRRPITLAADFVHALRAHRAAQTERRLVAGPAWRGDLDLVFDDGIGGPLSPDRLRAGFQRVLREAGLPTIRFHDLRHTMATLMLAAGEHPKVVSERLGHASVMLTLDTYSHVLPGLQEAAAERLADTLARRR
jgi:integrase